MEPDVLTLVTELVDDTTLVTVEGEVDLASAGHFREELERALSDSPVVVVDVGQMTFIDSSGLNALVKARRVAESAGRTLRLRHPTPMFLHLLHITRLGSVFVIDQDCESASPDQNAAP
jgi:anti-sigma B factor antagonist